MECNNINEWFSTKQCSECGSKKTNVNDRKFRCLNCGYEDDRDINAAKNILKKGIGVLERAEATVTQPK